MDFYNETAVNVATLLQEPVGSSRSYPLHLDWLELDSDLVATGIDGTVRLTRLSDEILANVEATAMVDLVCLRCFGALRAANENALPGRISGRL